jgi:hypothetical protein
MPRTADSLQNIWQKRFRDYQLAYPFTADPRAGLRYQKLDTPASWWHNPINPNSLRLTKSAFVILEKQSNIPKWKCELTHTILPKTMIQLEKHFTNPYYIYNMKTLYVFDERDFFILTLHANNLQQYLDNQN